MTTVFSGGAAWLAVREGLGWTTLGACAQLNEQWQQNPAKRRADKRITGFTADASSRNFETLGKFDFGRKFTFDTWPMCMKNPEIHHNLPVGHTCSATSLWSTTFVEKRYTTCISQG
jgi:hypothetical protein